MPIKDVLLPLVGEPGEQAIAAIEKCVAVAGDFGARVVALAIEQDVHVRPQPISPDLDNAEVTEAVRSVTDTRGLLRAFDSAAVRFGVRNEQRLQRLAASDIADTLAEHARLTDLSLVPMKQDGMSEKLVERLLFGSGRVEVVEGITDARNAASIRLLERVGMRLARTRRAEFKGEACTEHVYCIARAQWDESGPGGYQ